MVAGVLLACGLFRPPAPALGEDSGAKDLTTAAIHADAFEGTPPSGFLWSPAGDRCVFMRRDAPEDTPLLYLYDVASRRSVALTSHEEGARKLAVAVAQWSPDGDALLAVAQGDLYLLGVPRDAEPLLPRRLAATPGEEKDPKFSPDGTQVGFVRDRNLHAIDLATGRERALTAGGDEGILNGEVDWVYDEELDISSGWWWSPDSSRLAYLQFDERAVPAYPIVDWIPVHPKTTLQHYPKAGDPNPIVRVGVVPASGGTTTWMDTGADTDIYIPRVAWTRGGSLMVQRLTRAQTRLDLMACDPRRGACRGILREDDPKWLNVEDDWKLLQEGFLWGSERDGFRHLYHYDDAGRLVRRLTQGSWRVTDIAAVDERSGWVYFTATEKSPLQRHLYRVKLDGAGFTRLTREEGWHDVWANGAAGGAGAFIDVHSTANEPPRTTLRGTDGSVIDTLDEGVAAQLKEYRRGRVEFRSVPASDGTSLPASIILPPDFDPGRRYPVLVYVYGGPHAQVVADHWAGPRGLWHQMMAARGVIVWSLDNRGMGARGHAWETPIHRDMGRRELSDQLAGVAYLRSQPWVDGSRIGIWGWSYGGYMTLYTLLNAPEAFAAGVAVAPVTDWRDYDSIYTERYMGLPADNAKGYADSAPLLKAAALRSPLLLVHGSSDDNVHMQNSVRILDAFVQAGRPVDFMLYPGKGHAILGKEARTHLFEKITAFLSDNLLKGGPPP